MSEKIELEDEIDELKVADFFDTYEEYIFNEIIPMAIAKYLALGFSKDILSACPIKNHINSAIDIFNLGYDINIILPRIEEILIEKYYLKIVDYQTTKLEKIDK